MDIAAVSLKLLGAYLFPRGNPASYYHLFLDTIVAIFQLTEFQPLPKPFYFATSSAAFQQWKDNRIETKSNDDR
jgi:hypothetical protein